MKHLTISDTVQVQGGLTNGQTSYMITMTVGLIGDAMLNAALKPLGIQSDGYITKYVVIPGAKVLFTYLGYETANLVLSD